MVEMKTKAALRTQMSILKAFQTYEHQSFPVQAIQVFLEVALNEGITITEVSQHLGIGKASASRNAAMLGERHRSGRDGYGLMETRSGPDPRHKLLYLTKSGHELAATVAKLINK